MFDTWKILDLLHKKLDEKNQLKSGRKLFDTTIEDLRILIYVGYKNNLESQKHIHENVFLINSIDKEEKCTFVEFVKLLQSKEIFDDFKFQLEEKLLGDL